MNWEQKKLPVSKNILKLCLFDKHEHIREVKNPLRQLAETKYPYVASHKNFLFIGLCVAQFKGKKQNRVYYRKTMLFILPTNSSRCIVTCKA